MTDTPPPVPPANVDDALDALLAELHRRITHDQVAPARDPFRKGVLAGELMALRGSIGILLGGRVRGGAADRLGAARYDAWKVTPAAYIAMCRCEVCG